MTTPEKTPVSDRLGVALETRLLDDGTVSKRKLASSERRSERFILRDIYAIVQRPVDIEDFTSEMAEFLVNRWHKEKVRPNSIRIRLTVFERTNKAAVVLGLAQPQDFTSISPQRRHDWGDDRRSMPIPEATKKRGKPSNLTMALTTFLSEHYVPERLVGRSKNTVRLYEHTINAYSRFLGRQAVVGDFNTQSVAKFLQFMLEETKLAPATIEKDRTQLTALWNFAAKKGWIAEFPTLSPINVPQRIPDSWTEADIDALVKACERQKGFIGRIPAGEFWLALLSVVFDTAERIGALMDTEWSSLDSKGALTIRGEHRKGGRRDKRFRLQPITVERLKAIKRYGDKKLFPWPYCKMYLWTKYGKLLEDAGLPNNRRTKFHKVRRTVASNFEAAGGNATELLDHQSRKTTTRCYLDPDAIRQTQPVDILQGFGAKLKKDVVDAIADIDPEAGEANETLRQIKDLLSRLPKG